MQLHKVMANMVRFKLQLAVLFSVLVQANCIAQEFQNTLKPRVVFERDFKNPPFAAHGAVLNPAIPIGILTRTGTELLVSDPADGQIIVVDTTNFSETQYPIDFQVLDMKTDAESDMLFLEVVAPSDELWISDQVCYEKLETLKKQQPLWKFGSLGLYQEIRWLKDHQRFIVYSGINQKVVLLDQKGVKLAEQTIKGNILGVDETVEGFNLFVLVRNQIDLTPLDAEFKVGKSRKLANVDRNTLAGGLDITRNFRLRGLKPGEVTKYFLNVATRPGYLTKVPLPNGDFRSRLSFANMLSAAESFQPEIITGQRDQQGQRYSFGFFLFDQQSNYFYEPVQQLTDAIFGERKLIVTRQHSKKLHHWTVRLISFE